MNNENISNIDSDAADNPHLKGLKKKKLLMYKDDGSATFWTSNTISIVMLMMTPVSWLFYHKNSQSSDKDKNERKARQCALYKAQRYDQWASGIVTDNRGVSLFTDDEIKAFKKINTDNGGTKENQKTMREIIAQRNQSTPDKMGYEATKQKAKSDTKTYTTLLTMSAVLMIAAFIIMIASGGLALPFIAVAATALISGVSAAVYAGKADDGYKKVNEMIKEVVQDIAKEIPDPPTIHQGKQEEVTEGKQQNPQEQQNNQGMIQQNINQIKQDIKKYNKDNNTTKLTNEQKYQGKNI